MKQIVEDYNNTPHRIIGRAPSSVTFQNSAEVYKKMFGDIHLKVIPKLSKGDKVRLLIEKNIFDKGYTENWTEEIYRIKDVQQQAGVVWYRGGHRGRGQGWGQSLGDGDTNLENRGPGTETVGTNIPGTEIPGRVPGIDSAGTEIPGTQISRGQLSPYPAHLCSYLRKSVIQGVVVV